MSASGSRKEEVTSNLPLCSSMLQIHLLGCQLKPLERLPRHMGEAGESEETRPPLWGCSLTALFIFNCQKSLLILSSPLCVIRSVVVILQPGPSLRRFAHYPFLKTIPYVNIFLFKKISNLAKSNYRISLLLCAHSGAGGMVLVFLCVSPCVILLLSVRHF